MTQHTKGCRGRAEVCGACYLLEVEREFRKLYPWVAVWRLDAVDVGVPQFRDRVFLVAGPEPRRPPRRTHADPATLPNLWEPHLQAWRTMGDYVRHQSPSAGTVQREMGEPAPTDGGRGTLYAEFYRAEGSENVYYPKGNGRAASEPERLDRPSPTVTTTEAKGTRASPSSGFDFHGGPDRASDAAFLALGRRRLEPDECAALQAFPIGWPFRGNKTGIYRQVGDAVPPPLARAVAEALLTGRK